MGKNICSCLSFPRAAFLRSYSYHEFSVIEIEIVTIEFEMWNCSTIAKSIFIAVDLKECKLDVSIPANMYLHIK